MTPSTNKRTRTLVSALSLVALTSLWPAAGLSQTPAECASAYERSQQLKMAGKLIEARADLMLCGRSTCPAMFQPDCVKWAQEVEVSLPSVIIDARGPGGAQTDAVRVLVDGQLLAARLEGKALEVNPGMHTFRYEHEGVPAIEDKVLVQQGEKLRRLTVSFAQAPAAGSASAPPAASAAPSTSAPAHSERAPEAGGSGRRTAGFVVGGLGLLSLGAGTFFGLRALSKARESNDVCPDAACSSDAALSANDSAKTAAWLSDIGLGVGVLATGVGAYLLLTAGPSSSSALRVAPAVGKQGGGLSVGGRF